MVVSIHTWHPQHIYDYDMCLAQDSETEYIRPGDEMQLTTLWQDTQMPRCSTRERMCELAGAWRRSTSETLL